MSIKIYNGFKFETSDIQDVMLYVGGWRSRIEAMAADKGNARLSQMIAKAIDDADMIKARDETRVVELDHRSPRSYFKSQIMEKWRESKAAGLRYPMFDFDMDVDIIPFGDAFYGVVRTDQREWPKAWLDGSDKISDFSYWNNSDEPEGVTPEEWEQRGLVWEQMLDAAGWRPAYAGFTCTILQTDSVLYRIGRAEELVELQPPFEGRIKSAAEAIFQNRRFVELATKEMSSSEIMKIHYNARRDMRSPEFADEFAEALNFAKDHIRPRLEKDDFMNVYEYSNGASSPKP